MLMQRLGTNEDVANLVLFYQVRLVVILLAKPFMLTADTDFQVICLNLRNSFSKNRNYGNCNISQSKKRSYNR